MQHMKAVVGVALILLGQPQVCLADDATNPIENVVTMLKNLGARAEQEGRDEALLYQRYETWCETTKASLEAQCANGKQLCVQLDDEIQAKGLQDETLRSDVQHLEAQIKSNTEAEEAATQERASGNSLYTATDQELAETIAALAEAIDILRTQKSDIAGNALLAVKKVRQLPRVISLVSKQQSDELLAAEKALDAPLASPGKTLYDETTKTYEFKSDNVIDLMYDMKEAFEKQRMEATTEETRAANSFELTKDALQQAVLADGNTKNTKQALDGEVQAQLQQATSQRATTQSQLDVDEQALSDVKSDCAVKASEWADRQKHRALEIESINAGVKILQDVAGLKLIAKTTQTAKKAPVSFLQIEDPKQRAMNLLREKAKAAHSETFQKFAQELESHLTGPFSQVNAIMESMILRLMAEQKDEDEHKTWCDVELAKTNSSGVAKEADIRGIVLKKEADKATSVAIQQDVADVNALLEAVQKQVAEASEIRTATKAENEKAMNDAKIAQEAISKAQGIIEDFYKTGGYQLLQQKHVSSVAGASVKVGQAPETWSTSYGGVEGQPEGIISVLKECSAQYARMAADTRASEQQDKQAYEEQMQAFKLEKSRREKELQLKTEEQNRLLEKVSSIEKQQNQAESELAAIKQYAKDLEPACVEGDSTYEERKAARQMEIDAVKEAQVMLADAFGSGATAAPAPASAGFLQAVPVRRAK